MDPNANLDEQRKLSQLILDIQDNCSDCGEYMDEQLEELGAAATRLAELVQALDNWITHRAFLPDDWR